MNAFDKFVGFFSPKTAAKRARFRAMERAFRKYEGAASGRRTKNWKADSTSANAELGSSLVTLRNRSRQLVRDNPYASRGVQAITSNVVGWGVMGQIKVDSAQKNASGINKTAGTKAVTLQNAWRSLMESTAIDFDGRNDLYGLQRLIFRAVVESGEVFVRLRRPGNREQLGADGYPIQLPPVQFQVLESDFCPLVDVGVSPGDPANTILHGVEFDPSGRRVAYHLYETHPGTPFLSPGQSITGKYKLVRIPADEILHVYRLDRPGQIRGAPWLSPVMLRLKDFDEYEDAQLVRQKIAAMFAVFVRDLEGVDASLEIESGELGEKVEPGIIELLPPGKDITLANPPTVQGFGEYSSTVLHSVAAGLGITFEALTGDLSQVNFSSARMGFLEMSRNVDEWRDNILISQFLAPAFKWWVQGMEIMGVDMARARPVWTPPRREMVDPSKEISANKDAVRAGFLTLSEVIRNAGYDPETHFKELADDQAMIKKLGLVLDSNPEDDANRIQPQQSFAAPQP